MDTFICTKIESYLQDWEIVREIGNGSFGQVYEIARKDCKDSYRAALKIISIPKNTSELKTVDEALVSPKSATSYYKSLVEDLSEEIRLMYKLKGESNIVSYEDHKVIPHNEDIGWDILIRMELLTPLIDYSVNKQLDAVDLGIDICRALELCSRHNIIHRDIKPENIFVSDNGHFKLGDFGIAKVVERGIGTSSKIGTYSYMAPEVYKGNPYDARVDIYSLGIVLYRFLNNGRLPFWPDNIEEIRYSAVEKAIQRRMIGEPIPRPVNADDDLAKVILTACEYNPDDRYDSPKQFREALERVKANNQDSIHIGKAGVSTDTIGSTVSVFGKKPTPADSSGESNPDNRCDSPEQFRESLDREKANNPAPINIGKSSISADVIDSTVSVFGKKPMPADNGKAGSEKKEESRSIKYNVDIAMCIDATGSMGSLIDTVKNHALSFYDDLTAAMNKKRKHIDELRVRMIVFRDYLEDGDNAMLSTDFFSLPNESKAFEDAVKCVEPFGGGDEPEDGLEALAYAIKSGWTKKGNKKRHIIIVWSDDATHALGFGSKALHYPGKMAKDFDELSEWWGDAAEPGFMDNSAKRLLIFAPDKKYWSTIAESWDNVLHYVSDAGKGLCSLEYEEILNAISNSI